MGLDRAILTRNLGLLSTLLSLIFFNQLNGFSSRDWLEPLALAH